ncbi:MAG: hypothetical protein IPO27_16990 [Bacteroidetes bacterium]|nr:hypothetical protein [Bacteroidota bacterium]
MLCMQGAYSQGRNANWVFGDSAGMHFDGLNTPAVYKTNCKSKGESSTISDKAGNLLFYEFGISSLPDPCDAVYDNDFELMTNGDSIFGDTWYNTDIIVPLPDNDSLYYLFSTVISNSNRGLYSAIISKPNFLSPGVVLTKNIKHTSRQLSDCIQAVKHGNGRDWWIIVRTGAVVPSDSFLFGCLINRS